MSKKNIQYLNKLKKNNKKAVLVTAYSFPIASIADNADIDIILVGDSAAMTMMGFEDTLSITMDEMIVFSKSVSRAVKKAIVIGDMPFLSYATPEDAVKNSIRFIKEANVDGIKMEGGSEIVDIVKILTKGGVPVMGHIGLLPQRGRITGYAQRKGNIKEHLLEDAIALKEAGVFSIIIESVDKNITKYIWENIDIPIYCIGSGPYCDGQILVIDDIIGLYPSPPPFAKKYANIREEIEKAIYLYREDVKKGKFPQ